MRVTPSEKKAKELLKLISGETDKRGPELFSSVVRKSVEKTIQELIEAEQTDSLGRERYERTEEYAERKAYRNGYMPRKLRTAEGVLSVEVPQVRGGETPFRSEIISRFTNRTEALENLVIEMYAHGLSVRDIESSLSDAIGEFILSDTTVSVISERMHEEYEQFRKRPLGQVPLGQVPEILTPGQVPPGQAMAFA